MANKRVSNKHSHCGSCFLTPLDPLPRSRQCPGFVLGLVSFNLLTNNHAGVFFRKFTVEKATSYSLTGYVRNTSNGKVEGEAQGEEESIKHFLKDLNKGPTAAHVVRVDRTDKEIMEGEGEFRKVKNVRV